MKEVGGKMNWNFIKKELGQSLPSSAVELLSKPGIFSILANSHSLLQSGQTFLVFNQRWMQSKWKTWPHTPNAMDKPASKAGEGLAWREE